jgi:hypothetical protein
MNEENRAAEQVVPRDILGLTDDELEVISGGISEQLRKDFFSNESST